jgi:hypothetical protein
LAEAVSAPRWFFIGILIMTSGRLAAYIGGASLLLAWLAAASGDAPQSRGVSAPSRPGDGVVLQTLAADVQAQAARLRRRIGTAPAPTGPRRNPFAFDTPDPEVRIMRRAPRVVPPPIDDTARMPAEPALSLLGIAEQATPGGLVRTAMISSGGDDLALVTEGQTLGLRYRVVAVGVDAVELKDLVTGATRRLALQ